MVISSASVLVEQQQYFFELLWNRAIPAKQRIREIEEGAKREFVETIREPSEIQKFGFDLIKAAEEEIVIIFSTDNAFYRQIRAGILQLLKEAVVRGVKIRMLLPMNKKIRNEIAGEIQELGIDIRDSKKSLLAKITTLVVDNTLSLTIQLNDGPEETSEDEDEERDIVLATYSNSESIVLTYLSIFENMWVHQHGKEEEQKRKTLQSQHL